MFKCPVYELGAADDTTRLVGIMDLADPGYTLDESIIPPDDCADTFAHYWRQRSIPEMHFTVYSKVVRKSVMCTFDLTLPFDQQDMIVIIDSVAENVAFEKVRNNTFFIRPFTVEECKAEYEQFKKSERCKEPRSYIPYKTVAMVYEQQLWFNRK
jgi:hypothetical protein